MDLKPPDRKRLEELCDRFLYENSLLNLSALRSRESCWVGNILDSLALLPLLPTLKRKASILDIGTGGGFPLLPLATLLPKTECTGIDATQKKIDAVSRIAHDTHIDNCTLICGRTEELGHDPGLREHFDIVLARAVAPLATLLEYCSPFCAVGGHVVLWKSLHIAEELEQSLSARTSLSLHLVDTHRYTLPGDWGERQLLVFLKSGVLPRQYPRAIGIPKSTPL